MNLTTITGQAAAVIVMVNSIQHATGWSERWFGMLLAVSISIGALFWLPSKEEEAGMSLGRRLASAFVGGFIVYATAFGGNQLLIQEQPKQEVEVVKKVDVTVPAPGGGTLYETRTKVVPMEIDVKPEERKFTTPW